VFEAFCKEKLGPLALRLALGLVCVSHGYLKIMAAGGTAWFPGLPVGWQVVIAWTEFAAGLAILVGFRCRWAATAVLVLTAGMLIWWHGLNIFRLPLRTLEPTILLLLMGLALLFLGAGELSIDARSGGGGGFAAKSLKRK
jgi:uncharacterized membrane protein YphA (DoxX/SURF4 family)